MTAYADFSADPQRLDNWLFEVVGRNPSDGSEATLYFSMEAFATETTDTPASQQYAARIVRGFRLAASVSGLDSGPLSGLLPPREGGSIQIGQLHGDYDIGTAPQLGGYPLRQWTFGGKRAVVKHGGFSPKLGRSLTYSEYRTVFDGDVRGEPLIGDSTVDFVLAPRDVRFDHPFEERRFFGTHDCAIFNGTTASINYGNHAEHDFTTEAFSVELLIYLEEYPATDRYLVTRGLLNTDGWFVTLNDIGQIILTTNQAGANQQTLSDEVPLYQFTRVSVRRNGAVVTVLFDGVDKTVTSGVHVNPLTANRDLIVGESDAGSGQFLGALDDVRVWNDFRLDTEVNNHAWGPLDDDDVADGSCVLYAKMDDGEGAVTSADSSGNGFDGTVTDVVFAPSCQGREDYAGKVMPNVFGHRRAIVPVLVDGGVQTYVIHAGSIESHPRLDIGGYQAWVSGGADYTSWLTMMTDTPPVAGEYRVCVTPGWSLVRLGGVPQIPFTMEIEGDNTGATYRASVSTLVRWLLCNKGKQPLTDPDDLDIDSFDDLETAQPAVVGVWVPDEKSIRDVISYLLSSIGAVGYFRLTDGKFVVKQFVGSVAAPTPTVTITENDAKGLEPMQSRPPVWSIVVRHRENDRPLSSDEVHPAIETDEPERLPFLKNQWSVRQARNAQVRDQYDDARELVIESAIDMHYVAKAEAIRQLAIYSTMDQGFTLLYSDPGVELDRMDTVYLDYKLLNALGILTNRFSTGPTAKFIVLAAAPDVESNGTRLTIWREEV